MDAGVLRNFSERVTAWQWYTGYMVLFIFIIIYLFPEFRMQQYTQQNRKVHNTIYAYMDTKGRMCHHLHSANKTKKCI